jgi:dual oxidase
LPPRYADGVGALVNDLPNPRALSEATQKGNTGLGSYLNRTALLVYFGRDIPFRSLNRPRTASCGRNFGRPDPWLSSRIH